MTREFYLVTKKGEMEMEMEMEMEQQLQADLRYCENIIQKHSTSFYYAFSGLPAEKRHAVYAIYAFCRSADDSVDENPTLAIKRAALHKLRSELDLFSRHEEKNHPLWRALRHVFQTFDMDIQPFYDQLIGQEMDIRFSSPKTLQHLEDYSYYVAGSVGLMLLPIIASENKQHLTAAAIDLGVAMQITNILRDVGEDFYTKNRIYLPETERLHFGYSEQKLEGRLIDQSFIALWEHLAKRAEGLYDTFLEALVRFDADSRQSVALAANAYREILHVIRGNAYDCLSKRNTVAKERLQQIRA